MVRKVFCVALLCFSGVFVVAQNVASINGKPLDQKEFMWFYKKNNPLVGGINYNELVNYLDNYINFKLKVLDAKKIGLDKDTAYLDEVKNYEKALRGQKRWPTDKPEFGYIINEYKDAVLMFNVSEMKIWSKPQEEQNALELEWLEDLRKRYPVKVYHDQLKKMARP